MKEENPEVNLHGWVGVWEAGVEVGRIFLVYVGRFKVKDENWWVLRFGKTEECRSR